MNLLSQIEMADSKTFNSYEYAIESISSTLSGKSQTEEMLKIIKKYTENGWKVHTIYSNELGKNAVAFMGLGVNSTQSEDIIIFERHVQYNVMCHTEKDLLVTNYCADLPVRFGLAKMFIPQNTDNFLFALAGKYGNGVTMEAFRVDVEFITIFDEKISVNNISFVTNNKEKTNFITEPYEIHLNKNEIKLIKAAKIYVKSYVMNGKAHSVGSMEYVDVNEEELTITQKNIYGQEYFHDYAENESEWTCVCGKVNNIHIKECPICGRKLDHLKKNENFDLATILEMSEEKHNANEIFNWLKEYNEEICNEIIAKILEKLKETVEIERLYGCAKSSAIDIIKSFIGNI